MTPFATARFRRRHILLANSIRAGSSEMSKSHTRFALSTLAKP